MERSNMKLAGVTIVAVAICLVASFCWYGSPEDKVARSEIEAGDWIEHSVVRTTDGNVEWENIHHRSVISVDNGKVFALFWSIDRVGYSFANMADAGIVVAEDKILEVIGTETISTFRGDVEVRVCSIDTESKEDLAGQISLIGPGNVEYKRTQVKENGTVTEYTLIGSSLFLDNEDSYGATFSYKDRDMKLGEITYTFRDTIQYDTDGSILDRDQGMVNYRVSAINGDTLSVDVTVEGEKTPTTMTVDEFIGTYRFVESSGYEFVERTKIFTVFGEKECDVYSIAPSSDTTVYAYFDAETGLKLMEHKIVITEGDHRTETFEYHYMSSMVNYEW